jgi:hypothetical protein
MLRKAFMRAPIISRSIEQERTLKGTAKVRWFNLSQGEEIEEEEEGEEEEQSRTRGVFDIVMIIIITPGVQ